MPILPREIKNVEKVWEKNYGKIIDKVWHLMWLLYRKSIAEGREQ